MDSMTSSRNPLKVLKEEFSRFDTGGKGEISSSELKRSLRNIKVSIS